MSSGREGLPQGLSSKDSTCNAGGEGNGNPLQYSCLENPMDRGAWWAAIYRVAQSQTQLKWLSCRSSSNAGITGDIGLIPGSGRSPREGHGNPLQSSCLDNPMDQGAWWATVHGVAKNQTQLRWLSMHTRRGEGQQGWICGDGVTVPLPPTSNSLHRTIFKSLRQEEEELCQELEKIFKKKKI